MLFPQCFRKSKTPEILFKEVAQCRDAYQQDPLNKENLRKWLCNAFTMRRLFGDSMDPIQRLEECTTKLEDAMVKTNDPDPESWFMLGLSYYSLFYNGKHRFEHRKQTIACLRKGLEKEPNQNEYREFLALVKYYHWPLIVSPRDHEEDVWEEECLDRELIGQDPHAYDLRALHWERSVEIAEDRNRNNPNDADTLRDWGTALLWFAYYQDSVNKERAMILEAIGKLEKALELNPEDKLTRLNLVRGQLRLRIPRVQGDDDYVRLLKEYRTLSEEGKKLGQAGAFINEKEGEGSSKKAE